MREFWVNINPKLSMEDKNGLIVKTVKVASAFIVEPDDIKRTREAGAKKIVSLSDDADIKLIRTLKEAKKAIEQGKETCIAISVKSRGDENKIVAAAKASVNYVIVECPDWKVIPLENIIASIYGKTKLIASVLNHFEARTALETLELGADGVVTNQLDSNEMVAIYEVVMNVKTRKEELELAETVELIQAQIIELKPLNSGARVCIDTCDLMQKGEGLLVGCQSTGLFLIEAEVHDTPFVAPRPFRVNAGSIALYVLTHGGKTRYLSELKAGDEVLIVNREGKSRNASICRVKIEWRPLLIIEAECENRIIKTVLQNAETIRVVTEKGSKSVSELAEGDKVLVHVEEGGRHFGKLVREEKVIER